MRTVGVFLSLALLAVLLNVPPASAQSEASVRGTIHDPQGAVVAGAKVTLTKTATQVLQETVTNADGIFVFPYVEAGNYTITIQKEGFRTLTTTVRPSVAEKLNLNLALELGSVNESVTISENPLQINTVNGELAYGITGQALQNLPLLNRNYYQLMQLAPGAVNTGDVTGDTRGTSSTSMAGSGGVAVSGARTSSINYMLDGGENNDTFVTGPSQIVPLDSIQEFKVQSNGADASFGRNPIETNAITKSGTNNYHGSIYEYYRGAALSTAPFFDKANDLPTANFVRNQFGGSLGGPIKRDKLFFFAAAEAVRVGGSSQDLAYVPDQFGNFLSAASPSVVSYLNFNGGVPASNCNNAPITAQFLVNTLEGGNYAATPLRNQAGVPLAPDTILLCQAPFKVFTDTGGGFPQSTYYPTGRLDWNINQGTTLFGRYSYLNLTEPAGTGNPAASFSPYPLFNSPFNATNQNATVALTHSFSPNLFSELRLTYNRVNNLAPLGQAPATAPCWQYANGTGATPSGNPIDFPGYFPNVCAFAGGLPTGGPQNIWQIQGSGTKIIGKHTFQFGANYWNMHFNYTFGAFEQGYYQSDTFQDMMNGQIDTLAQAINPRGLVPGQTYCTGPSPCTVSVPSSTPPATTTVPANGPLTFPSFTRHYIYNEGAIFAQDAWKVTPHLTLNLGLRWEYFGVQHSVDKERFLDWNLYYNLVGGTTPQSPVFQQIQNARFTQTNQFYKPQYDNFGPRVGLAYDLTGHGTTVFRAAYGLYYDRNFGNATFNVIQNPSPYAVLSGTTVGAFGTPLSIVPDERDIINAVGGQFTISSSARQLFVNLKTAYNQQWNATLEHNRRGVLFGASYVGIHGVHLYSLNNLNPIGGCLLLIQVEPSAPCDPTSSGSISRINQSRITGMNQRANDGFSSYNALQTYVRSSQIGKTGVTLNASYTLSHSIDNESSFFADALFEGIFGFGFKDPFAPSLDRASSTNDIRNRAAIAGVWELPWRRNSKGLTGQTLGGWGLAGIFTIQTGAAFTVYNGDTTSQCFNNGTNFCYPVLTSSGPLPPKINQDTGNPDSFVLYNLANAPYQTQTDFCAANTLSTPLGPFGGPTASPDSQLGCTAALYNLFPNLLAGRNQFRTPGIWNVDGSIAKNFNMPREGQQLRFQADFLNLFNHANLYAIPGTNKFAGTSSTVLATFGVTNSAVLERRNIQLSLRYIF